MINDDFLDLINEAITSDFSDIIEQLNSNLKSEMNFSADEVKNFSDEKLCSLIASNRYIKISDDLQLKCMKELVTRRDSGSDFNFEQKIEEYLNQLPAIDLNSSDVMSMLNNFTKKYKL